MFTGELGYKPHEFFCLLPREMNEVIEGHNIKLERDKNVVIYKAKCMRKAAYISILPHIKPNSLSEQSFNMEVWPIDEEKPAKETTQDRVQRMQMFVQQHNKKLSEARRLKEQQKK